MTKMNYSSITSENYEQFFHRCNLNPFNCAWLRKIWKVCYLCIITRQYMIAINRIDWSVIYRLIADCAPCYNIGWDFGYWTWWIVTLPILTLAYTLATIILGSVSIRWHYNWSQNKQEIPGFCSDVSILMKYFTNILYW